MLLLLVLQPDLSGAGAVPRYSSCCVYFLAHLSNNDWCRFLLRLTNNAVQTGVSWRREGFLVVVHCSEEFIGVHFLTDVVCRVSSCVVCVV